MTAFSVDIREKLTAINTENEMKTSGAKLMESVCEVVKFHSDTKQLSLNRWLLYVIPLNLWLFRFPNELVTSTA